MVVALGVRRGKRSQFGLAYSLIVGVFMVGKADW